MRDWASSGRVKIDRARQHIRDLEVEIARYRERHPYVVEVERYSEGFGAITDPAIAFVICEREAIPLVWSAMAGDAVHNMSAALDHLWTRAIPGSNGNFPMPPPHSVKPFFEARVEGRERMAREILRRVDACEVESPFRAIRAFDNADKHDTIVLVAGSLLGAAIKDSLYGWLRTGDLVPLPPGADLITPAKRALPIFRDRTPLLVTRDSGPPGDLQQELTFEIVFGESEVLEGQPVIRTLTGLADAVESLATAFIEAELLA